MFCSTDNTQRKTTIRKKYAIRKLSKKILTRVIYYKIYSIKEVAFLTKLNIQCLVSNEI